MSPTRVRFFGVVLGLAMAGVMLSVGFRRGSTPAPMLSECDGAIRSIVIQYVSGADFAIPVYRDFLTQLHPDVTVYAVCPDLAAFDELSRQLGGLSHRLTPLLVGHEMTAWSRDRWVALRPASDGFTHLLYPRQESGAEIWPARAGDGRLAEDLAKALHATVSAEESGLYFDGGDLIADDHTVFVTPDVIWRNVEQTVKSTDELGARLSRTLGRPVVLLEEAPRHHAGMFMMMAGDRTVLVADPSLGREHLTASLPELPDGADFTPGTQRLYDAVAEKVAAAGYRVVRIPVIPSCDGKTFLTYVNVIIDRRDGQKIVYMPVYRGAESLNDAAEAVWQGLGYEVRRVDCTSTYRYFGNLHCLVNVLEK